MKLSTAILGALAATAGLAQAATFYPISSVSSSTVNFFDVNNLIEGPGVGYTADEPHTRLGSTWVTDAPGGFPSDYVAVAGAPVITLDLGVDSLLSEISVWGYSSGNANGASEFSLRFATSAEGTGGFGSSIAYNPTFGGAPGTPEAVPNDDVNRLSYPFSENVTARYVELTITDNWFNDATGGTADPPGGDRVGLGEVAFEVIPEPSAGLFGALGLLLILRRRR